MPSQQQAQSNMNGHPRPQPAEGSPRPGGPFEKGFDTGIEQGGFGQPDRPPERPEAPPDGIAPHLRVRSRPVRVVRTSAEAAQTQTRKRGLWVYVKHALMHPWHVVVLAGATVFGVANWSLLVLLLVFAGAELMLLGAVLHLRAFRRYVDERLDQIERARAAEQRATLLLQMGDEHRRELLRLEAIVDRIRDATNPHGTAAQIAVDECLRLLASYVRLAIAHNVSRECLASVNRRGLEDEIRSLEAARFAQGPHTRVLAQRRIEIARKRAERWDRSREALDAISHQLAMIGELVQLTHEQIAAPADPVCATSEIDRVVSELDDQHSTLEELSEFLGVEEAIDPRVLDIGRASRA
ncbi:MAG TPA: hypothetical protein VH044_20215 [Polyangiaceae bacterium]|jgi:hypothetical protein|nr:hypothetical protein [Polyangiaceae bacterium]